MRGLYAKPPTRALWIQVIEEENDKPLRFMRHQEAYLGARPAPVCCNLLLQVVIFRKYDMQNFATRLVLFVMVESSADVLARCGLGKVQRIDMNVAENGLVVVHMHRL
jgi:hypothetical protein